MSKVEEQSDHSIVVISSDSDQADIVDNGSDSVSEELYMDEVKDPSVYFRTGKRPVRKTRMLPTRKAVTRLARQQRKTVSKTRLKESAGERDRVRDTSYPCESETKLRLDKKLCNKCRQSFDSNLLAICSQCYSRCCQRCRDVRHGQDVLKVSKQERYWTCPKCRRVSETRPKIMNPRKSYQGWAKASKLHKCTSADVVDLSDDDPDSSPEHEAPCDKRTAAGDGSDQGPSLTEANAESNGIEKNSATCSIEVEFEIKREHNFIAPLDDMVFEDEVRLQTGPSKIAVASAKKEMCEQKVDSEVGSEGGDSGRLGAKAGIGAGLRTVSDGCVQKPSLTEGNAHSIGVESKRSHLSTAACSNEVEFTIKREHFVDVPVEVEDDAKATFGAGLVTSTVCDDTFLEPVVDLPVEIYLITLWFSREKQISGNTVSINLSDKEVLQMNAIRNRSPANGIRHFFNPTSFKGRPKFEKESMTEALKVYLQTHVKDCDSRVRRYCEEVEAMI